MPPAHGMLTLSAAYLGTTGTIASAIAVYVSQRVPVEATQTTRSRRNSGAIPFAKAFIRTNTDPTVTTASSGRGVRGQTIATSHTQTSEPRLIHPIASTSGGGANVPSPV